MFGQRGELLHRLALGGQLEARGDAGFGFAIEGVSHRRGAPHFAQEQHLDKKLAALVPHCQLVAQMDFTRRLGLNSVGMNASQVAGLRGQRTGLEEARRPKPFVDAYAGHECILVHWTRLLQSGKGSKSAFQGWPI